MEQVIDRSNPMNDIVRKSVQANTVHTEEDVWALGVAINDALLEMRRGGGGPVHINLETTYSKDFSVKELPAVKGICRITATDDFPSLDGKRILVYYGAHVRWTPELTKLVDKFCEKYDAAVMCEHISNYFGEYGVYPTLLTMQGGGCTYLNPDVMIHMGTVSGFGAGVRAKPKTVWRVHPDGEVRDTFRKLTAVFEMEEKTFFQKMLEKKTVCNPGKQYYKAFHDACVNLEKQVPDLPFSNAWMAYYTRHILPEGCELHLGILNTFLHQGIDTAEGVFLKDGQGISGAFKKLKQLLAAGVGHVRISGGYRGIELEGDGIGGAPVLGFEPGIVFRVDALKGADVLSLRYRFFKTSSSSSIWMGLSR